MSYSFSIDDFINLYSKQLMNKEEILKQLNISEYIYKKIIKEFGLKRIKTSKINRFKADNNHIEVIKITDAEGERSAETKKDKTETQIINQSLNQDIKQQIKKKLEESKKNRENKNKI